VIQMSTRPRCFEGIISSIAVSSIAELIAAYCPPMPMPAMNRVAQKKTTHPVWWPVVNGDPVGRQWLT
jgi:hypothetical protein